MVPKDKKTTDRKIQFELVSILLSTDVVPKVGRLTLKKFTARLFQSYFQRIRYLKYFCSTRANFHCGVSILLSTDKVPKVNLKKVKIILFAGFNPTFNG